ncbi:MAG: hypothetical protein RLY93_13520 [Sumerlaeia bacterium]
MLTTLARRSLFSLALGLFLAAADFAAALTPEEFAPPPERTSASESPPDLDPWRAAATQALRWSRALRQDAASTATLAAITAAFDNESSPALVLAAAIASRETATTPTLGWEIQRPRVTRASASLEDLLLTHRSGDYAPALRAHAVFWGTGLDSRRAQNLALLPARLLETLEQNDSLHDSEPLTLLRAGLSEDPDRFLPPLLQRFAELDRSGLGTEPLGRTLATEILSTLNSRRDAPALARLAPSAQDAACDLAGLFAAQGQASPAEILAPSAWDFMAQADPFPVRAVRRVVFEAHTSPQDRHRAVVLWLLRDPSSLAQPTGSNAVAHAAADCHWRNNLVGLLISGRDDIHPTTRTLELLAGQADNARAVPLERYSDLRDVLVQSARERLRASYASRDQCGLVEFLLSAGDSSLREDLSTYARGADAEAEYPQWVRDALKADPPLAPAYAAFDLGVRLSDRQLVHRSATLLSERDPAFDLANYPEAAAFLTDLPTSRAID